MKNQIRSTAAVAVSIIAIAATFGCRKPAQVVKGELVTMNYTLTVDDKVLDSSIGKKPMSFVAGSGQIIPGLDEQLTGMKIGEKKHVTLSPEKGYGEINPKALQKVPLKAFGDTKGLKPGMTITGSNGGRPVQAKVVSIDKKEVTLDMNHPLAGKTLNFDIEIVAIADAPAQTQMPASAPPPQK